jgi:hypothetical protein
MTATVHRLRPAHPAGPAPVPADAPGPGRPGLRATPDRPPFDPVHRLAERLAGRGVRHPQLAAAVLACRGRWVLDQRSFAALLGIPVHHVRSLEAGVRPPTHAPRRLAELDPGVDWAAAGVTQRGDPRDPASRHPAAAPHRREHAPP